MLSISSAQWSTWLALYMYPAARVLSMLAAAPVFDNQGLPRQMRLVVGLATTFAIASSLPPSPDAAMPGSYLVVPALIREMIIGYAMGFSVRLVFAAVDLAGDLIGLQMGLSFALFYDPQSAGQTTVLAEFLGLFTALTFLSLNGHLVLINAVAQSFQWLPAGVPSLSGDGFRAIVRSAGVIFSVGLLISLPAVAALLITNVALGVLTRAAPALNIFSLGFPITLAVGIAAMIFSLELFTTSFQGLFDHGFDTVGLFLRLAAGQ
ncbi:flagellar biosynthetic protein FliR [Niveibacterium sp. SC-1]|uniref:flagellar biosynthetic protein FliR n=1 Tax=Niveibacterium sp. SC-1 TaxID=3135646 RepID=UPI00311F30C5